MKKVMVLFAGAVVIICGVSLIGANADENTATPIQTGTTIGVGAGVVTEAPDWRNPAAIADKAVDKIEEIQETTTTTEAPVITAAPVMSELEINMAWYTAGGEDIVKEVADLMGRGAEPGVAEQLVVSASALSASAPDTEMGQHLRAAGDAYAQGAAAYIDAWDGDIDQLNAGLELAIEYYTTGNDELELATAAISG